MLGTQLDVFSAASRVKLHLEALLFLLRVDCQDECRALRGRGGSPQARKSDAGNDQALRDALDIAPLTSEILAQQ
jgi:hypothetical protein